MKEPQIVKYGELGHGDTFEFIEPIPAINGQTFEKQWLLRLNGMWFQTYLITFDPRSQMFKPDIDPATPVRLINKYRFDTTGYVVVQDHGYVSGSVPKPRQVQASEFDTLVSLRLKYLNLPKGTQLRISIQEVRPGDEDYNEQPII